MGKYPCVRPRLTGLSPETIEEWSVSMIGTARNHGPLAIKTYGGENTRCHTAYRCAFAVSIQRTNASRNLLMRSRVCGTEIVPSSAKRFAPLPM